MQGLIEYKVKMLQRVGMLKFTIIQTFNNKQSTFMLTYNKSYPLTTRFSVKPGELFQLIRTLFSLINARFNVVWNQIS